MAKYSQIWQTIKANGYAEVTVSKVNARSVESGVIHTKKKDNVLRKLAGLPRFPKLVITSTELSASHVKIRFELLYSIRL